MDYCERLHIMDKAFRPCGFVPITHTVRNAMKINHSNTGFIALAALFAVALANSAARASVAYGSINNFDTVNDTSNVCHGFEIELDDIRTTDITYTFDYNHYGTPKIT